MSLRAEAFVLEHGNPQDRPPDCTGRDRFFSNAPSKCLAPGSHTAPQINPFSAIMVWNELEGTIPESLAEKTKEFE